MKTVPGEETKGQPSLKDAEQQLNECRQQLRQVQGVLEKEEKAERRNERRIDDYRKLERELLIKRQEYETTVDALRKYEETVLMQTQFSTKAITRDDLDKVCAAYYEEDKKWYAARIMAVDEPQQTCEILWLGYKDRAVLAAKYIKVQTIPEPSELTAGTYCEGIYTEDGRWYPCCIERVTEDGYQIKFKKYGTVQTVPREYLRITNECKGLKRAHEDLANFKTPEHLKVKPSDTPEQKKQKKKKLKAIKQHLKVRAVDKEAKERQNVWLDFNSSAAKRKKGYYALKKTDSIFKSPETVEGRVGVTGSGKGMTKLEQKTKNAEPNAHKSRLF